MRASRPQSAEIQKVNEYLLATNTKRLKSVFFFQVYGLFFFFPFCSLGVFNNFKMVHNATNKLKDGASFLETIVSGPSLLVTATFVMRKHLFCDYTIKVNFLEVLRYLHCDWYTPTLCVLVLEKVNINSILTLDILSFQCQK